MAGLFDQYAHEYDMHMTGVLGYAVPRQLRELVAPYLVQPPLAILDLGCGTGLSGAVFQDLAHTLVGIDLSPNMPITPLPLGMPSSVHDATPRR